MTGNTDIKTSLTNAHSYTYRDGSTIVRKQISCCPFCGAEFGQRSDDPDSRYASGYECENCNEVLEIQVNRFPLA